MSGRVTAVLGIQLYRARSLNATLVSAICRGIGSAHVSYCWASLNAGSEEAKHPSVFELGAESHTANLSYRVHDMTWLQHLPYNEAVKSEPSRQRHCCFPFSLLTTKLQPQNKRTEMLKHVNSFHFWPRTTSFQTVISVQMVKWKLMKPGSIWIRIHLTAQQ
jgi:hypothetical protein